MQTLSRCHRIALLGVSRPLGIMEKLSKISEHLFNFITLWANSNWYFSYFSQKTGVDISCKLEIISVIVGDYLHNVKTCFLGKNKKKRNFCSEPSLYRHSIQRQNSLQWQFECHKTFAPEVKIDEKLCKNIALNFKQHMFWMTLLGWLGRKTSTQTNKFISSIGNTL